MHNEGFFSYEDQSLDVDRLYPDISPTITDNNTSDQTDGVIATTAAVDINVDETDNPNQANVSEVPASDHGGQVTNNKPVF